MGKSQHSIRIMSKVMVKQQVILKFKNCSMRVKNAKKLSLKNYMKDNFLNSKNLKG